MGIFDGFLICSDIDGTLIDDNFKIPENNLETIRYFQSEGGLFTMSTGRAPEGAKLYIDIVKPNAPLVCMNGAGIYDFSQMKYLWTSPVGIISDVIEDVVEKFPGCGVEVHCESGIHLAKGNEFTTKHMIDEKFDVIRKKHTEIKEPWLKIVFAEEKEGTDEIQKYLLKSPFVEKYQLVRSYSTYYEVLGKNTNKGNAVKKLGELLKIEKDKIITIGDNDNDAEMLLAVENSYAVKNASHYAKECAGFILEADNNSGAIASLIKRIENQLR